MSEQAGRKASVSIVGDPVVDTVIPMIDISPLLDGTVWMVADISKRVLSEINNIEATTESFTAGVGTTTTTIKKTNHNLKTGDSILNSTLDITRTVTRVDDDTLTMTAIVGQIAGDTIIGFKNVSLSEVVVNYVKGVVVSAITYQNMYIDCAYLPKTLVATANDYSYNQACEMGDITPFLATHKKRIPLSKQASGTLSYWDIADSYFTDALLEDTPKYIVLEDGVNQKALLAYFDKTELKSSIGSPQSMTVGFINANDEVG